MRIAMWSGPRNLSTAMMYSFAQRSDCAVVDEPFYAAYLAATGLAHPMHKEIIASQSPQFDQVAAELAQDPRKSIRYEKHMTQHILPGCDLGWLSDVENVFLIRHPARVIASYDAKRDNPTLDDIGFRQQYELFQSVRESGRKAIVVDSHDIRAAPEAALNALCSALGIGFEPAMLHWPAGGIPEDGVWAAHWYGAVHRSTGFAGAEGPLPKVPDMLQPLLSEALPYFEALRPHCLSFDKGYG